jgi:intraflagellar transport protein 122
LSVLQQLTDNAINEKRFDDAGYYNWVLSMQYLEMCKEQNVMGKFVSYQRDASIYYAYHAIQKYLVNLHDKIKAKGEYEFIFSQDEPFTAHMPEALFTIARFLLHETKLRRPKGVQLLYPFHN